MERQRQAQAQWERHILKTYGLTREEYDRIVAHQGGACYGCRKAKGVTVHLSVDHRHSDGLIRGALCGYCNRSLGRFGDDPEVFARLAEYLRNPPAVQAIGERYVPGTEG